MKSGNYALSAGRQRRRETSVSLWIARISAQAKVNGMNYSTLMHGLKLAGIDLNRKMLAEIAVSDKDCVRFSRREGKGSSREIRHKRKNRLVPVFFLPVGQ